MQQQRQNLEAIHSVVTLTLSRRQQTGSHGCKSPDRPLRMPRRHTEAIPPGKRGPCSVSWGRVAAKAGLGREKGIQHSLCPLGSMTQRSPARTRPGKLPGGGRETPCAQLPPPSAGLIGAGEAAGPGCAAVGVHLQAPASRGCPRHLQAPPAATALQRRPSLTRQRRPGPVWPNPAIKSRGRTTAPRPDTGSGRRRSP